MDTNSPHKHTLPVRYNILKLTKNKYFSFKGADQTIAERRAWAKALAKTWLYYIFIYKCSTGYFHFCYASMTRFCTLRAEYCCFEAVLGTFCGLLKFKNAAFVFYLSSLQTLYITIFMRYIDAILLYLETNFTVQNKMHGTEHSCFRYTRNFLLWINVRFFIPHCIVCGYNNI